MNRTELRVLAQHALDYEDKAETYVVILAFDGATYRREVRATSPVAAILLAKAAAGLSGVRVAVETVNPVGQLDVRQDTGSAAALLADLNLNNEVGPLTYDEAATRLAAIQRDAVEPWRKYVEHNAECGVYTISLMNDRLACTCGLSALLEGKRETA